jgi:hypothetical protein
MSYIYSDRKLKIMRMWSSEPRDLQTLGDVVDLGAYALDEANPCENIGTLYVEAEDGRKFRVAFEATLEEVEQDEINDAVDMEDLSVLEVTP